MTQADRVKQEADLFRQQTIIFDMKDFGLGNMVKITSSPAACPILKLMST